MLKKFLMYGAAAFALTCLSACGDDEPQKSPDSEKPGSTNSSQVSTALKSGLYLGIYGFNQNTYSYPVSPLNSSTSAAFCRFIDYLEPKNGTLLYYSVEQALDALKSTKVPADLASVALITFTDGLDQGSMMKNSKYATETDYLDALNNRIKSQTVNGIHIQAYSIGVRGSDVIDTDMFRENLEKLASSPAYATEVTNMSAVNARFQELAEQLAVNSYVQAVNLKMPGVANGTRVRFTFDNVRSAEYSSKYIEGRFNMSTKSLDNIEYVGMTSTSGSSVKGKVEGIFVNFAFEGLQTMDNALIRNESIDEWTYVASNDTWQINSEFDKSNNSEVHIEKKSALIMLVLDCSSSLGSQFATAQTNAKQFIERLQSAAADLPDDDNTPSGNDTPSSGATKRVYSANGVSFRMIRVDGGTFRMGSNDGYDNEKPVHSETVATFSIGETEVTQELWKAVMDNNPSYFSGTNNLPVEHVSWNDCQTFISKLNELTGQNFRLPTEAEWEYAARGGNQSKGYTYSGSNTLADVAWYYDNSNNQTHAIARKLPNELGLYDMSGNVWEWCSDWYSSNYDSPRTGSIRVIRGGSWLNYAASCRVAHRHNYTPDDRSNILGLRLAL